MSVKVVKFGGSSLADAAHFRQVASIIKADPARRFVVPSAPGKRFKEDVKEVGTNFECGISLVAQDDIKVGDIIETFVEVEVKQKL